MIPLVLSVKLTKTFCFVKMEGKGASRNEMGEKGLQWNDNSNPRDVLLNIQHVRVT